MFHVGEKKWLSSSFERGAPKFALSCPSPLRSLGTWGFLSMLAIALLTTAVLGTCNVGQICTFSLLCCHHYDYSSSILLVVVSPEIGLIFWLLHDYIEAKLEFCAQSLTAALLLLQMKLLLHYPIQSPRDNKMIWYLDISSYSVYFMRYCSMYAAPIAIGERL